MAPWILLLYFHNLGHFPTSVLIGHHRHCFKLPDRFMKRSVKSTHFLSLVQCLSLDMSFFSFQNSVSVFLFLFLCLLWLDESLWMHMYINSLGIVFRDRLKWDQVFRLELNLGDGTRVVCFFLETWVLFVLSLFYIGSAYQIHHLQLVSYVQFTIFLICESLIPWWLSW